MVWSHFNCLVLKAVVVFILVLQLSCSLVSHGSFVRFSFSWCVGLGVFIHKVVLQLNRSLRSCFRYLFLTTFQHLFTSLPLLLLLFATTHYILLMALHLLRHFVWVITNLIVTLCIYNKRFRLLILKNIHGCKIFFHCFWNSAIFMKRWFSAFLIHSLRSWIFKRT